MFKNLQYNIFINILETELHYNTKNYIITIKHIKYYLF